VGHYASEMETGRGHILKCGCVSGYERCFDCRHGIHPNQEIALACTIGVLCSSVIGKQEPLGEEFQRVLDENRWKLYSR